MLVLKILWLSVPVFLVVATLWNFYMEDWNIHFIRGYLSVWGIWILVAAIWVMVGWMNGWL